MGREGRAKEGDGEKGGRGGGEVKSKQREGEREAVRGWNWK